MSWLWLLYLRTVFIGYRQHFFHCLPWYKREATELRILVLPPPDVTVVSTKCSGLPAQMYEVEFTSRLIRNLCYYKMELKHLLQPTTRGHSHALRFNCMFNLLSFTMVMKMFSFILWKGRFFFLWFLQPGEKNNQWSTICLKFNLNM